VKSKLTMFLLVAVFQGGCQSTDSTVRVAPQRAASVDGDVPAETPVASSDMTARLYVKGMSCPLCANNIDKQLLRVAGVKDVSVDLGSGEVRAKLEPANPPTRDELARAIEQSGFTLDRIEMPPPKEGTP